MCGLEFPVDENLIVGLEKADDAGVYKISDELALIQTVDFFTPVVDDPHRFGQIAAANALSDVYAMGGIPKTAMNLVGFPLKHLDISVLRRVLEGGLDKMREAGVVLAGGHSVEDNELKYGLSVTGFVHPDRILTKKNLRSGDRLILTKPLGTGIITTAVKAGMVPDDLLESVTCLMATLNRYAADVMACFPVHACTDITGFGLLGHLAEMTEGSGFGIRVYSDRIPLIPQVTELAAMGLIPGGAHRNREFRKDMTIFSPDISRILQFVLFDPQTSGGLLISVAADHADRMVDTLREKGVTDAAVIGEVIAEPAEKILII